MTPVVWKERLWLFPTSKASRSLFVFYRVKRIWVIFVESGKIWQWPIMTFPKIGEREETKWEGVAVSCSQSAAACWTNSQLKLILGVVGKCVVLINRYYRLASTKVQLLNVKGLARNQWNPFNLWILKINTADFNNCDINILGSTVTLIGVYWLHVMI